jgi:hypothetical protein
MLLKLSRTLDKRPLIETQATMDLSKTLDTHHRTKCSNNIITEADNLSLNTTNLHITNHSSLCWLHHPQINTTSQSMTLSNSSSET